MPGVSVGLCAQVQKDATGAKWRFKHILVNLVGPLLPSHEFTYHRVVPLSYYIDRGRSGFYIHLGGLPADLNSNRGVQFTSELWTAVVASLGFQLYLTACAYNVQGQWTVSNLIAPRKLPFAYHRSC